MFSPTLQKRDFLTLQCRQWLSVQNQEDSLRWEAENSLHSELVLDCKHKKYQTHHNWVKTPPYVKIWDSVGTFLDPPATFHFTLKHSFSVFTSFSYLSFSIKLPFTIQLPLCLSLSILLLSLLLLTHTHTHTPWLWIKKDNTHGGVP